MGKLKKLGGKKGRKRVLNIALPTEMTEPERDIRKYVFLIYAPPGWGKTTLFASFPGACFFCTERGTKGLRRFEFNVGDGGVRSWEIFEEGVRRLEEDKSPRFKNVIVDTGRKAYEYCSDAYCKEHDIERPGVDADGKSDWGESWKAIAEKFMMMLDRILRTGRGVGIACHSKEVEVEDGAGEDHNYVQPNLNKSAMTMLTAYVDFGFCGEMILTPAGDNARVLITEGNEGMWGKHRELEGVQFPRVLPVPDKESGYSVIRSAFLGKEEHLEIDLDDLRTGVMTSKGMADLLATRRMSRNRRKRGGKKVLKKRKKT